MIFTEGKRVVPAHRKVGVNLMFIINHHILNKVLEFLF